MATSLVNDAAEEETMANPIQSDSPTDHEEGNAADLVDSDGPTDYDDENNCPMVLFFNIARVSKPFNLTDRRYTMWSLNKAITQICVYIDQHRRLMDQLKHRIKNIHESDSPKELKQHMLEPMDSAHVKLREVFQQLVERLRELAYPSGEERRRSPRFIILLPNKFDLLVTDKNTSTTWNGGIMDSPPGYEGDYDSYGEDPPLAVLTFSLDQISTPFDTSVNYTLESLIEVRDQINSYDFIDEANWPFRSKKHMFDNVHSGHIKIIDMVEEMAERGWEVEDMLEVQWDTYDYSDAE
ncbi:MAG: hypothetical protein Q9174_005793 [Haloplaca sp. 1 TL-2023]